MSATDAREDHCNAQHYSHIHFAHPQPAVELQKLHSTLELGKPTLPTLVLMCRLTLFLVR